MNEIAVALSKAQAEFKPAKFDSSNPHFRSRYASLNAIVDAIREPLAKHGIAYTHLVGADEVGSFVETRLIHSSGQFLSSKMRLVVDKNTMQAFGSAITYARRFTLSALCGVVADEDDDGNAVSIPAPKAAHTPAPKPIEAPRAPVQAPQMAYGGEGVPPSYIIPFGPYEGKEIASVPLDELVNYATKIFNDNKGKIPKESPMAELLVKVRDLQKLNAGYKK